MDRALTDEAEFRATVDTVVKHGGVLGGLTFLGEPRRMQRPTPRWTRYSRPPTRTASISIFTWMKAIRPTRARWSASRTPRCATGSRAGSSPGIAARCRCSTTTARATIIGKVAEAGIAVVSLPMCNMYLQDRTAGRTPRWRGVAPLHELDAAGVTVMVASDNTRDPFYAYGDLDMLEVHREATRILHFDHSDRPWLKTVAATPGRGDGPAEWHDGGPAHRQVWCSRARAR